MWWVAVNIREIRSRGLIYNERPLSNDRLFLVFNSIPPRLGTSCLAPASRQPEVTLHRHCVQRPRLLSSQSQRRCRAR